MTLKSFLRSWAVLVAIAIPAIAHADVTLVGGPQLAVAAGARGASASAFDYVNQVYLVVTAHGQTRGRFISAAGVPIGSEIVIQSGGGWAHFPRVAFSPHADGGRGAFLVTWFESVPNPIPYARLVSYVSGPMGTAIPLTAEGSQWETTTPAVAYSTVSQVFLVAWENVSRSRIRATLINNHGEQASGVFNAAEAGANGGVQKPTVTYNSATNEFLVAWSGWSTAATVDAQRVSPSGALIGGPIPIAATLATYQVDAAYNQQTNQYLIGWGQNIGGAGQGSYGRVLNGDGSYAGNINVLSTRFCTTDSFSVAYNTVSQSYLIAAMDSLGPDNGGAEINASGLPLNTGLLMTATGNPGNYYPRLSASNAGPEWIISAAHNYLNTYVHRLVGSGGGQPPPPPPPPPPPATPDTRLYVDSPQNSATVPGQLSISGWAIDLNSSSGTGVDAIHAYAFPLTGGQIFLGAASATQRLDVASHFGNSRFNNSGFALTASLPPGIYTVGVYARSTVAGSFNTVWTVQIRVTPPSNPQMALDQPRPEWTSVPTSFWIRGWALDTSSFLGPGVDAIYAWAYPLLPTGYGAPILAGATTIGGYRPDVAAAFGNGQFATAGFDMVVTLPPGTYDVVVYARSWIAGSFNNWRIVRVTTQ